MMLTKNLARTYQSLAFTLAFSLILNMPTLILASLTFMVFIAVYSTLAWRKIRRITPNTFNVVVSVSPNPASRGGRVRVRMTLSPGLGKPVPLEVYALLHDVRLLEGSNRWEGIVDDEMTMEFSVTSDVVGLRVLGPFYAAVKDGMGFVVKEMEIHPPIPLLILSEAPWINVPPTSQTLVGAPSPGHSKTPFMGSRDDYRVSLPQDQPLTMRDVDWRRTARSGGEEIYVKEYDRRRKSNIVFGIGTGIGDIEERVLTEILYLAYLHIIEGSNPWIMFYVGGGRIAAAPLIRGLVGLSVEKPGNPPSGGISLYISRLTDVEEVKALKELSRVMDLRIVIPASKMGDAPQSRAFKAGLKFNVVEVDELPSALTRILVMPGSVLR